MRAAAPPAAFAERSYARGDVIWSERPLVALQAARSRGSVLACACCLARLGGANGHLAAAARRASRAQAAAAPHPALPPLPLAPAIGAPPARAAVACARGCGELFCDDECASRADSEGHRLLCVGPLDEEHELYRFKCHALAAGEDAYLLAAQARPSRDAPSSRSWGSAATGVLVACADAAMPRRSCWRARSAPCRTVPRRRTRSHPSTHSGESAFRVTLSHGGVASSALIDSLENAPCRFTQLWAVVACRRACRGECGGASAAACAS